MKTKFTPGPWHLDDLVEPENSCIFDSNNELVIAGEYEGYVCPFDCKEESEATANVYLVSTAPELYILLQEAIDIAIALGHCQSKWFEKAKIILAKAKGEEI